MTGVDRLQQNAETFVPGADAGEFSWGPGLTPPGLEDAPPHEGGRYRGTTPPMQHSDR